MRSQVALIALAIAASFSSAAQADEGAPSGDIAHLASMRVSGRGVLELKFSSDFPNPSLHLERRELVGGIAHFETITRVPMVGRERLVLAPGAYRITASSDGATPAAFDVELDPGEVMSFSLLPGPPVMPPELFWSIAAGAAVGIIAGYLLVTSAVSEDRIHGLRFSLGLGSMAIGIGLAALAWVFRDEREPSVVRQTGHLPAGGAAADGSL